MLWRLNGLRLLCLTEANHLTNREVFMIMKNKCKSYSGDALLSTTHPKLTLAQEDEMRNYRGEMLYQLRTFCNVS